MSADNDRRLVVLTRTLRQVAGLLAEPGPEDLGRPTPCREWTVGRLVDHLVADPGRFANMLRGEQPDWSGDPHVDGDPAAAFRSAADDLLAEWHGKDASALTGADWQTAEFAVHSWDLLRALGRPTDMLDAEAAERGLAFMRANLAPEARAPVFDAEQPAPAGASIHDQLAAFAGRSV